MIRLLQTGDEAQRVAVTVKEVLEVSIPFDNPSPYVDEKVACLFSRKEIAQRHRLILGKGSSPQASSNLYRRPISGVSPRPEDSASVPASCRTQKTRRQTR